MEGVGFDGECVAGMMRAFHDEGVAGRMLAFRRDVQFLVAVGQVVLTETELAEHLHLEPDSGIRSIRPDEDLKGDRPPLVRPLTIASKLICRGFRTGATA